MYSIQNQTPGSRLATIPATKEKASEKHVFRIRWIHFAQTRLPSIRRVFDHAQTHIEALFVPKHTQDKTTNCHMSSALKSIPVNHSNLTIPGGPSEMLYSRAPFGKEVRDSYVEFIQFNPRGGGSERRAPSCSRVDCVAWNNNSVCTNNKEKHTFIIFGIVFRLRLH